MRAPLIPGRKPEDDGHREAMLRRLGIAEEKPASRWDAMVRDVGPTPPVQTPPPLEPTAEEPVAEERPILMTEAPRLVEAPMHDPVALDPVEPIRAEPSAAAPVAAPEEPAPSSAMEQAAAAGFMPGWGEESIPEDETDEAEAFVEAEEPVEVEAAPEVEEPVSYEEPEVELEAEAEPEGPSAEVIFIEHALAAATVAEAPLDTEVEAEAVEAPGEAEEKAPLIQALEQIRADLEVICQYVDGASSAEVSQATPVVAELLQLGAILLTRAQTA